MNGARIPRLTGARVAAAIATSSTPVNTKRHPGRVVSGVGGMAGDATGSSPSPDIGPPASG